MGQLSHHRVRGLPGVRILQTVGAVLLALVLLNGCSSGNHPRNITLTFVRHAESEANAAQIIDTTVPGPPLSAEGMQQALQGAKELSANQYDGIYASAMQRAQQTAEPLSAALGRQVEVLPGLNEIDAGWFEGKSDTIAEATYLLAPIDWLRSDRTSTIPGSVNGNEFNDQFQAAVRKMYVRGDANPVAFSHGAAIMIWTLMNVRNPDDTLAVRHPLPNMGHVVITGNPITGWKLVDWDGIRDFG
ncbi:histidine phosphatase family protein [Mycobacterium koreense]|uniref:Histidine phosphatase family protein n=1 Tax=Mycolicibacillus koreensis TaxID=1069220 RepID=A0A7I7SFV5_9MYCO|nr:histidine phosphatase family protein [Mycolicibacillus koreensis]MCV7250247.1 histidine phosphatase family protein [Mycolicibacillus koreensis]OSC32631.1 histidine phosphatase family protein [Mycolicibacillus koreensis]BBY54896.1 histidine phosphatase family protein [Mycolicibacillus koreensis]